MFTKKYISRLIAVASVLSLSLGISASAADMSNIKIPDSVSYFDSIEDENAAILSDNDSIPAAQPRTILSYVYQYDNSARLQNFDQLNRYARISGTAITIPAGSTAEYVKSSSGSVTKETAWGVSAQANFSIKLVEAEVRGNYDHKTTASTTSAEQWTVNLTQPGTYNITWYMIGHKYGVWGNCKFTTTDQNDGKIMDTLLGYVTFPTKEVHMDIAKV